MKNGLIQQLIKLKQWWFNEPASMKEPPLMKEIRQKNFQFLDASIRLANLEDIKDFESMQAIAYQGYIAWNESHFIDDWRYNPYCVYLIIEREGQIIAMINGRIRYQQAHISHVIVLPTFQHQGNGTLLIEQWLELVKWFSSKQVTLEVRESNQIARYTYQKMGFKEIGIHPNYYMDNQENAIMMQWQNEGK